MAIKSPSKGGIIRKMPRIGGIDKIDATLLIQGISSPESLWTEKIR